MQASSFEQIGPRQGTTVDKFMEKVVVFSCTNRPDSFTLRVSKAYANLINGLGFEAMVLDFRDLSPEMLLNEHYDGPAPELIRLSEKYIRAQNRFIFISPEYNGSFPGILKLFLDKIPPRDWMHKQACLVGVSQGRAGNLRGMEHLTGILHYLKMHVYFNKLPISLVDKMVDEEGRFISAPQEKACLDQVRGFLALN